jgi:hypothetical protein
VAPRLRALAESLIAESGGHPPLGDREGWQLQARPGEVMLVWTKRW